MFLVFSVKDNAGKNYPQKMQVHLRMSLCALYVPVPVLTMNDVDYYHKRKSTEGLLAQTFRKVFETHFKQDLTSLTFWPKHDIKMSPDTATKKLAYKFTL